MGKPSRKKRRRDNRRKRHDFSKTVLEKKAAEEGRPTIQKSSPTPETISVKSNLAWEKGDIINTLLIAGIIFAGYAVIFAVDQQTDWLTELGKTLLSNFNTVV